MGWGASAPDTSATDALAAKQASIGEAEWRGYNSLFLPTIDQAMRAQMGNSYWAAMDAQDQSSFNSGEARRLSDRYWNTQVPLEDSMYSEAMNFDTPAEQERMAAQAGADVQSSFGASREQLMRQMYGMGIDPTSAAAITAMGRSQSDQAAQAASAMNQTRQAARQLGWSRKLDAAALGRNLPGFTSSASGTALGWNGQAVNAGAAGLQAPISAAGSMSQAGAAATGAMAGAGQNYGVGINAQQRASEQNSQMTGAAVGAAATIGAAVII